MYDISIIGAGVVGCNIARELSKYDLKISLIEKSYDVSNGASKANSGIVHGGYAAKHGTLKSKFNVLGNKMYEKLNQELNFGYRKTGGLVIGFEEDDLQKIKELYENGLKNNVENIKIIERKQILDIEPNINPKVKYALYSEDVGITSPYEFTIALAENAVENGVELYLNSQVKDIKKEKQYFEIYFNDEMIRTKYIINAAGINSDKIAKMVNANNFKIIPKKGQYIIFEKGTGKKFNNVIFQVPTKKGKGVLVTSTYHGNLMIGPNSEETDDREDISTDIETLKNIIKTAKMSYPDLNMKKAIRTYSGLRASSDKKDFIIEESRIKNFINVSGIESPGLTSSPAIAIEIKNILSKIGLDLIKKEKFSKYRKPIIIQKELSDEEVKKLLNEEGPKKIICRCERVYQEEIVDALTRNIEVKTLDSVKRRTRAGMGKCQGSFCSSRVSELIKKYKGVDPETYKKQWELLKELKKLT